MVRMSELSALSYQPQRAPAGSPAYLTHHGFCTGYIGQIVMASVYSVLHCLTQSGIRHAYFRLTARSPLNQIAHTDSIPTARYTSAVAGTPRANAYAP